MKYIRATPNPSGAYPAPQSNPFPGAIPLADEQAETVLRYNGFVTITSHEETIVGEFTRTVYTVEPDLEAWEAWKESLPPEPEPEPSVEERVTSLETAIANGLNLYEGDLGNA